MEYQDVTYGDPSLLMVVLVAAFFFASALLLAFVAELEDSKNKTVKFFQRNGGKALFAVGVICTISLAVLFMVSKQMGEQNRQAVNENIKAKYDVSEVSSYNPSRHEAQEIHVVTTDDNGDDRAFIFLLQQNEDTFEPTLLDPPVPAGQSTSDEAVEAADLLKK